MSHIDMAATNDYSFSHCAGRLPFFGARNLISVPASYVAIQALVVNDKMAKI
jgi:hypothetical protein